MAGLDANPENRGPRTIDERVLDRLKDVGEYEAANCIEAMHAELCHLDNVIEEWRLGHNGVSVWETVR